MTQSEKLQKVIERAVKNGWNSENPDPELIYLEYEEGKEYSKDIESLIFRHDFAKAFFQPEITEATNGNFFWYVKTWAYHIQKLALTPPSERIDYLYNFIEEK